MNEYYHIEPKPELSDPELKQWFSRGKMRRISKHSIFTIDEGGEEKAVILLIHGFPTSSWDWQPIWAALRQENRVLCLDMLGFGFSDKPKLRNYSIHKQADLIEEFLHQQQVNEFHVLAHDYGVSVAQELIARQIDQSGHGKVTSCCFLNGGLFPETHNALLIQRLLLSQFGFLVNKLLGFKQFGKSFSSVFGENTKPSSQELSAFWEAINFNDGKHVFSNLITYMNDRIEHRERWVNALRNAPLPLSLINGSVDPVSGKHLVARFKELNCRLDHVAELKEIGHYPQVESPERVASAYLDFLRQSK